ncbi:aminoacyl--tRNA ligase-related protein [Streptomyces sp. NPDC048282]|uniref:aminoacyl--tRNA ligase-related protein n=1 Tax=Streptomyces sp. NPDC048282 TaxID=3365528 RepID=UPI003722E1BF
MTTRIPHAIQPVSVDNGLATLGPEAVRVRAALDAIFVKWARDADALEVIFPPLIKSTDLERFDFFTNFPHLALAAVPIGMTGKNEDSSELQVEDRHPGIDRHQEVEFVLPSAACYQVYLSHTGARIEEPVKITTLAQCFRREIQYDGLRRLHGFGMREIIAIGSPEVVRAHLAVHKNLILEFSRSLGIELSVQVATDPFFDPNGSRAVMQRLFPTKEEFISNDGTAVASINYHRNFFGQRADISLSGEHAYTSCVAFGIERWLHIISKSFDEEWGAAEAALHSYLRQGS